MKNLSLFPGINKRKAECIFSIDAPTFFYERNGEKCPLIIREESNSFELRDDDGIWNADEYNLGINLKIRCESGNKLYGIDPYDIENLSCACDDAIIGLALAWSSQESKQRSTIPVGIIENISECRELSITHKFDKAALRGNVSFSLILYIKKEGIPKEDESIFANKQGYILGEIYSFNIVLDGRGSYFTIAEVNRPGESLWSIEYDIDDPSSDLFSDSVSINLNKAHSNYKFIDRSSDDFNLQLFIEIVSSSMITVIETVRSQDESFDCLNSPEEGSVAQALLYFRDVLEWDFSSPITLSYSVRNFFNKNSTRL